MGTNEQMAVGDEKGSPFYDEPGMVQKARTGLSRGFH